MLEMAAEITRIEDDMANIQEVLSFTVQAKVVSNSALDIINAKMGRSDDGGGNLYPHVSSELLKSTKLLVNASEILERLLESIKFEIENNKTKNSEEIVANVEICHAEIKAEGGENEDAVDIKKEDNDESMEDIEDGLPKEFDIESVDNFIKDDEGSSSEEDQKDCKNVQEQPRKRRKDNSAKCIVEPENEHDMFNCHRCKFETNVKEYFDEHLNGSFNLKKCPYCPKVLRPGKGFSGHLKTHKTFVDWKANEYKCDECNKIFTRKNIHSLRHHKETCHEGILYHCIKCPYNATLPQHLKDHIQAFHEGVEYKCKQCNFTTKYARNLTSHVRDNHSDTPGQKKKVNPVKPGGVQCICDICGKVLSSQYLLDAHKRGQHMNIRFQCDHCDYSTNRNANLKKHMHVHTGKKVMCDQCPFSTTMKENLDGHIQRVHGKREILKCDLCNFQSKSYHYLWRHKKKDHSERGMSHKCTVDDCTYTCMYPSDLKRHHDKVHLGIRYQCELCDFSAGYKTDLYRHVRIVHQDFKLTCSECEYSTTKRHQLKEHMNKCHGQMDEYKDENTL